MCMDDENIFTINMWPFKLSFFPSFPLRPPPPPSPPAADFLLPHWLLVLHRLLQQCNPQHMCQIQQHILVHSTVIN